MSILILGIGNLLLKDEGVGIHVIRRLEQRKLPNSVHLMDGGTGGLNLFHHLTKYKKVILIDAINAHKKPGEIIRIAYDPLQLQDKQTELYPHQKPLSMHETNFTAVLELAKEMKIKAEIIIFGIQPQVIDYGEDLSPEVKKSIPLIIKQIMRELKPF